MSESITLGYLYRQTALAPGISLFHAWRFIVAHDSTRLTLILHD